MGVTATDLSPATTKTGRLQRAVLVVLERHEADGTLPTSIRFIFYELEQDGTISKVRTGVRRSDQDLIDAVTILRDRGLVPWDDIVDETRSVTVWNAFRTGKDAMLAAAQAIDLSPWTEDHPAPLIICESRSLAGVLAGIAGQYAVPITSTNGQSKGHIMNRVLPVYRAASRVLNFGDADLSGGHIEDNTRRVLEQHSAQALPWERLAITPSRSPT